MDPRRRSQYQRTAIVGIVGMTCLLMNMGSAWSQVRGKRPDRGSYRSPVLEPVDVEPVGAAEPPAQANLRQVNHTDLHLVKPVTQITAVPMPPAGGVEVQHSDDWGDQSVIWDEPPVMHEVGCDGCDQCDGCDAYGCDTYGCDSIGRSGWPHPNNWANASLSLDRNRWFGSVEVLMMFRKGDRLPPLVTTGPDTDVDTAGELGRAGTQILYGDDRVLEELTAGGRFTIGTWIDRCCSRSLVLRGWFAGEEKSNFGADEADNSVLTRPFLNVTDANDIVQDTRIIAFPDLASGSISIQATSEVYGADISARQKWFSRFGGTVDVLYGYQYMRMNENLNISDTSTALVDGIPPIGSILAIDESFDAENEFHGGQFGFASRYREGCWSFHSLAKVGFGRLKRTANLQGQTTTTVDDATAVDPNGLLVRSTNAGKSEDNTFGWVPELDFTLGWHRYRYFDVTVGYHVIAMTDAIQVSGLIDSDLAVNTSDPVVGQQSPARRAKYNTFYVQGIHFGLQRVY